MAMDRIQLSLHNRRFFFFFAFCQASEGMREPGVEAETSATVSGVPLSLSYVPSLASKTRPK